MKNIILSDKEFSLFIPASDIRLTVKRIAEKINHDYTDKEIVLLAVMNGAVIFAADLIRKIKVPCKLSCVRVSSYHGDCSTGNIQWGISFDADALKGKHVIVVEDIVDSGTTMECLVRELKAIKPASVAVATLLFKPQSYIRQSLKLDYVGYEISDHFVIGYGLDYNGMGRQLEDIYRTV